MCLPRVQQADYSKTGSRDCVFSKVWVSESGSRREVFCFSSLTTEDKSGAITFFLSAPPAKIPHESLNGFSRNFQTVTVEVNLNQDGCRSESIFANTKIPQGNLQTFS